MNRRTSTASARAGRRCKLYNNTVRIHICDISGTFAATTSARCATGGHAADAPENSRCVSIRCTAQCSTHIPTSQTASHSECPYCNRSSHVEADCVLITRSDRLVLVIDT